MIRIGLRRDDSRTIVSVAGRLDEEHLAELQEQCPETGTKLVFDLSDLTSAYSIAIQWLGERLRRGDEIKGASAYIRLLLEREQLSSDPLAATRSINEGDD